MTTDTTTIQARIESTLADIHEAAQAMGRLGGHAGKGKPKNVPPKVAHARAKKAGAANRERWARIMADRKQAQANDQGGRDGEQDHEQKQEGALPHEKVDVFE